MKRLRGKKNPSPNVRSRKRSGRFFTVAYQSFVVSLAIILVGSLIDHFIINPTVSSLRMETTSPTKVEKHIQVSVRNECGVSNIAMDYTDFLRKRGFDVVETDNGSGFDRKTTTVVDATGNYQNALKVAEVLGVQKRNVVTRIDPHAYVDVEVLIGSDYVNLKPKEGIE